MSLEYTAALEQRYLAFDLETTEFKPERGQLLEVGAVIEDWVTPIDELPSFHFYVRHKTIFGNPIAIAMNAEIIKKIGKPELYLGDRFVSPHDVLIELHGWLIKHNLDPLHLTAGGKNVARFDIPWLLKPEHCHANEEPEKIICFRHRVIDPAMLYWNPAIDGNVLPDSKTCLERAGLDPLVEHKGLPDAKNVIRLIRARKEKLVG